MTSDDRVGRTLPVEMPGNSWSHCISLSWLTGMMIKAWRTGFSDADVLDLPVRDQAINNAQRLQRLWELEIAQVCTHKKVY